METKTIQANLNLPSAVELYREKKVSLGKAMEIAGLNERGVPINYTVVHKD